MEQLYTHNQLKLEIYLALAEIVRQANSGIVVADRMRFSYPGAESSVEPDGAFVSFEALREKRVRQLGARAGSVTELEGAPEMVLEIVSDSSEEKDADKLPTSYAQAGVREFWPADVRTGIRFEIYHLGGTGYQAAAEPDGWQRSDVFDRSFRLSRNVDAVGMPRFRLEAR